MMAKQAPRSVSIERMRHGERGFVEAAAAAVAGVGPLLMLDDMATDPDSSDNKPFANVVPEVASSDAAAAVAVSSAILRANVS